MRIMQKYQQNILPTFKSRRLVHRKKSDLILNWRKSSVKIVKIERYIIGIPFACNSSREKQLPIDSGRVFNLLFETFNSDSYNSKQSMLD